MRLSFYKRSLLLGVMLMANIWIQPAFSITRDVPYWISVNSKDANKPNTWIAFRRNINIKRKPMHAMATIAADTKYWLWINGRMVVFEGGLKRGPTPKDTYADKVDLAPYLRRGNNQIAVLLWHFGKDGFSHVNSGRSGLFFSMEGIHVKLYSDSNWLCRIHPAYSTADGAPPNYRLPESNILFDARKDMPGWQTAPKAKLYGFENAAQIGMGGGAPWNALQNRPIPQWKDYGIKHTEFKRIAGAALDTIIASLPYNMQITPVITIKDDEGGHLINIVTDHSKAGGTDNVRAAYITTKGLQEYESYGWMNGEKIILTVPHEVIVTGLKYRETGYDTEPTGSFICSDDFYNRYWKKARRTLYLNMRDNFFDCPDRERAQWWGDVVLLMGECFYTYSPSTHALMRKAIRELTSWRRANRVLFSPVPGNFNQELPDQMLTSIGYYGFWNYYMNTGDRKLIEEVYPAVKDYLALWRTDETGLTELRKGDWLWGDWGENKDIRLIIAGWHYLALDGAARMAALLGKKEDEAAYRNMMQRVKEGYNKCWNGTAYRHASYNGATDDRAQALAVLSGIADSSKYNAITSALHTQQFASPYMEKYVMEALFKMGEGKYALARAKSRFNDMVADTDHTTLFEGWGIGEKGYGGGTTNHAWSGGAQIVIASYLFGVKPLEAGYNTFLVEPNPATFISGTLTVPTINGKITVSFNNTDKGFRMKVVVPQNLTAIVRLPEKPGITVNDKQAAGYMAVNNDWQSKGKYTIKLKGGTYIINSTTVF